MSNNQIKLPSIESKKEFSFKDVLLKNDLAFEKKPTLLSPITDWNKRLCDISTFGDIEQLKDVPINVITVERKLSMIECLKTKIMEIETWIQEDQNQHPSTIKNLKTRYKNTKECIKYLESIKIKLPSLKGT